MSERIIGTYDNALYKSTYTLLYFIVQAWVAPLWELGDIITYLAKVGKGRGGGQRM